MHDGLENKIDKKKNSFALIFRVSTSKAERELHCNCGLAVPELVIELAAI
jgi:hypothetical protein